MKYNSFIISILVIGINSLILGNSLSQYESNSTNQIREGTAEDQFLIGLATLRGNGMDKDPIRAGMWFRMAAERGHAGAQNALASLYCDGNGISTNYNEAKSWFVKSAESGNSQAMCNIARMYELGLGERADIRKAIEWYQQASDKGEPQADLKLGEFYYFGDGGLPKDYKKSVYYFEKASKQGIPASSNYLGVIYEEGYCDKADINKAAEYYKQSAKLGFLRAMTNLGRLYTIGQGLPKNELFGIILMKYAVEKGDAPSLPILLEYSSMISPNIVQRGYKEALDLIAKSESPDL